MNTSSAPDRHPVFTAPLAGLQLIEASAGTGKTWTIAGLYLRLLLERQAPVAGILAVTFTRAATAELRERIRSRMQELLDVLEGRASGDDFTRDLLAPLADREDARRRLHLALRGFDDAAIHTIHGFCQRALAEHAFASGVAFDCEVVPDISELLHEVTADFWRRELATSAAAGAAPNHGLLAAWLAGRKLSLAALVKWGRGYVRREGLRTRAPEEQLALALALDGFRAAFAAAAALWNKQAAAVEKLLLECDGLNRRSYAKRHIPNWCAKVSALFAAPATLALPEQLERFAPAKLLECATGTPPAHAFFDCAEALIEAAAQADAALVAHWRRARLNYVTFARAQLAQRFAERKAQSYDDLLLKLHDALAGPRGAALAEALRTRYPFALIDEFQDTDPLQWGILERIYGSAGSAPPDEHAAFLVGDPKQSIYSFRGADLHAYLNAITRCATPLPLRENQRSVPPLVQALNALFTTRAQAFRDARILYHEVHASPREKAALVENGAADAAPLRIAFGGAVTGSRYAPKEAGHQWATEASADEIARLLAAAARGDVLLGERPLRAGDIAVLVNAGYQAGAVREALAARGIGSAELSMDSVFHAAEAEALERLLLAVAAPRDAGALRAALATDLLGFTAQALAGLDDESAWEPLLGEFEHYHQTWRERGLMRMLRELFRARDVAGRLAQYQNGERRLTNLHHLCELLHAEQDQRPGIDALLAWLASRRREALSGEAAQLRLDSDAGLIQIVTIHRSKGLEYPICFVPFLWNEKSRVADDDIVVHHDPAPPHELVLDAGSEDFDAAQALAREEELGEKLRVAYVALTRAQNRCYLFSGALSGLEYSAPGWLLHDIDAAAPDPARPEESRLRGDIERLCESSGGSIRLHPTGESSQAGSAAAPAVAVLAARPPPRAIRASFALTSFTGLLQDRSGQPRHEPEPAPDHDQADASAPPERAAVLAPGGQRFAFPRGSAAGICLHAILERIDGAAPARWAPVVREQLARAGYATGWAVELQAWLGEVLATPLPMTLAATDPAAQRREMAFQLAVASFSPRRIVAIAQAHGLPVSDLGAQRLRGYLSGYMDLVFRHEGRWYVADYKSNWLGPDRDSYGAEAIAAAMAQGDYHLQYLIYTLALHRWLRVRLPGYDYERDVGGALYLFLRGMHPLWRDAQGQPLGVFAQRPSQALIEALDEALGGGVSPGRAGAAPVRSRVSRADADGAGTRA